MRILSSETCHIFFKVAIGTKQEVITGNPYLVTQTYFQFSYKFLKQQIFIHGLGWVCVEKSLERQEEDIAEQV